MNVPRFRCGRGGRQESAPNGDARVLMLGVSALSLLAGQNELLRGPIRPNLRPICVAALGCAGAQLGSKFSVIPARRRVQEHVSPHKSIRHMPCSSGVDPGIRERRFDRPMRLTMTAVLVSCLRSSRSRLARVRPRRKTRHRRRAGLPRPTGQGRRRRASTPCRPPACSKQ